VTLDAVASQAGYAKLDDFFAAVARDEVNLRQIQAALRALAAPAAVPDVPVADEVATRKSRATGAGAGILIVGVDRLMTGLARCCKPAPPDPIVGFVTRGKGISIHRASCANLARVRRDQPERLIEANWGSARDEVFPVDIVVESSDRPGLLRDLSEIFSKEKINVTAVNTLSRQHLARLAFTLEVRNLAELRRALVQVAEVPGVLSASRR
jgi:GTP pyrophosphokinase